MRASEKDLPVLMLLSIKPKYSKTCTVKFRYNTLTMYINVRTRNCFEFLIGSEQFYVREVLDKEIVKGKICVIFWLNWQNIMLV